MLTLKKSRSSFVSLSLVILAGAAFSNSALADHRHSGNTEYRRNAEFGRVTEITPIYRTVKHRIPVEQCWVETVEKERRIDSFRPNHGAVVGGLIGAAIGNRVGEIHNHHDKLSVLAGAIIGASIGDKASRNNSGSRSRTVIEQYDVERCETSYQYRQEQQLTGYDVSYRYQGRLYRTHTIEHPGRSIPIRGY